MRGVYRAKISITGLNSARTLLYLTAPSTGVIEILEASITNKGSNVTNQQLEATLQRVTSLGTPTGTSITPGKSEKGDQASGASAVGNVTASEPTYGANTEQGYEGFSSLAGYRHQPIPEDRVYIQPSETVGLRMLATPTAFDADVEITYREIG